MKMPNKCGYCSARGTHCLECGADITDELAGQAEDAADAAQDR